MKHKIILSIAAVALGTAVASAPAFAKKVIVIHPVSYSNTGPWKAPLSPNGIGAAANAFGGPGYNGPYGEEAAPHTLMNSVNTGPYGQPASHNVAVNYSNTGPWKAPLSPNGIGAASNAFGGPGFNGPYGQTAHVAPVKYSNAGPSGAPLSPNGIGAAASAFGGPGYNGPY